MRVLVWVALIASVNLVAQTSSRAAFKDYPVEEIYRGVPVPPKLSKEQRTYRTVIRTGAKSPVEFAGHYTVPRFGCGAGCSAFYIVDSTNGKVYDGLGVVELPMSWQEKQPGDPPERLEYHPNSRLLRINGCPNETNCGFYDYVMVEGKGLKLIRKQLLPKEFQL
jgi:hypothetical protein